MPVINYELYGQFKLKASAFSMVGDFITTNSQISRMRPALNAAFRPGEFPFF